MATTNAEITIGYHKIRGLGAPMRMMAYYANQNAHYVSYGDDMQSEWFGKDKPALITRNPCINLPYLIDGDLVITQSNTCALHLGKKFGIDVEAHFVHNHTVLDQTMDLRNDLMKVVYPFGSVKTKAEFADGAKKHMENTAKMNFTKLDGFCRGPYMCGAEIQSGDFMLFEMLDQHVSICAALGEPNILDGFPKLAALHAAVKADPKLGKYFASDMYLKWAQNNGLFTHFTGQGPDFVYGPTERHSAAF